MVDSSGPERLIHCIRFTQLVISGAMLSEAHVIGKLLKTGRNYYFGSAYVRLEEQQPDRI